MFYQKPSNIVKVLLLAVKTALKRKQKSLFLVVRKLELREIIWSSQGQNQKLAKSWFELRSTSCNNLRVLKLLLV